MDARNPPDVIQFEQFRLDRRAGRLLRDAGGAFEPVGLGSRAISVLCTLVDRSGFLVSKDEIMAAVWPDTAVEEANLTVQISALRRVLDQGRRDGSCIQTIAGRGYRFVPIVTPTGNTPGQPDSEVRSDRPAPPATRRTGAFALGAVALAGFLSAGGWWSLHTAPSASTATGPPRPLDRRQSVIILPFQNSSGDAAQDSLAAEITRGLTARLARTPDGPVISGTAAEAYQGKPVDSGAIGRERGVHFALTGNARREGGHLIVSAFMYETADGSALWSRQFDVPDGPDEPAHIAQAVYANYWQKSVDLEAWHAEHDHPGHLDKRDLILMALSTSLQTPTREHYLTRLSLMDRALALDPNNLVGLERQARLHAGFVVSGYSSDPAADLAIAAKAADHALAIDPNSLLSLRAKAAVLRARGAWIEAEAVLRRVLELQPTEANRHYELGQILMAQGRHQEALASFQAARRFAGGADPIYEYDADIGMAELALGQFAEASATARLAMSEMPPDTGRLGEVPWLALIAARSAGGDDDAAHAALHEFVATPRNWHSLAQIQRFRAFALNPKLVDGLRRAGMPET